MSEKLTNEEILNEIGNLAQDEANALGLTKDAQEAALKAAGGDRAAISSFCQSATPLYNTFCQFVVKFAATYLSKAKYRDVYRRHHRNMLEGRPELGFVYPAGAGTGNDVGTVATSTQTANRGMTTVVTAELPTTIALYGITQYNFVARVPISDEEVKTAFARAPTASRSSGSRSVKLSKTRSSSSSIRPMTLISALRSSARSIWPRMIPLRSRQMLISA